MPELSHQLNRTIVIKASPETVFRFFTDNTRWAKWWGPGSTIDPSPGGKVFIRYPNGVETVGEVLEVIPPTRLLFTYGYASGKPIPPGASTVTIKLEAYGSGTRLSLTHVFGDPAVCEAHVQGWRFQLSVFANLVANEVFSDPDSVVDAWFAGWAITDAAARKAAFDKIAAPDITFRDLYSLLDGTGDLLAHVAASQVYMPGIQLKRDGSARHCQGTIIADWSAAGPDGKPIMSGTNVFELGADGRITSAIGFTGR